MLNSFIRQTSIEAGGEVKIRYTDRYLNVCKCFVQTETATYLNSIKTAIKYVPLFFALSNLNKWVSLYLCPFQSTDRFMSRYQRLAKAITISGSEKYSFKQLFNED